MSAPEQTVDRAAERAVDRYAHLTPAQRAHMAEIRARNGMVMAIAGESWGKKLTPIQQRAFAEYMRRFRLDIAEVDNLGGRPYRNGRYYMRRIAELAAEGKVEWYKGEHIGPDERLDQMAKAGDEWATAEKTRRLRECIRLGVPADAEVVYVVAVKMKALALPTEGVKWWSPGRTKLGWRDGRREEVDADPIGDEHPVTSVETRAWRRVGRLAAAEIPELRAHEAELEAAADDTQHAVLEEARRFEEQQTEATIAPKPLTTQGEDPYAEGPARVHQIGAGSSPLPDMRPRVAREEGDRISRTPEPEPDHIGEREFEVSDGVEG